MLDVIADNCHYLINNYYGSKNCQEYLDSRINKESQDKFKFGFFPDLNSLSVLSSIIGEDVLEDNKLLYYREIQDSLGPRSIPTLFFENYPLIIPFRNAYGKVVALVGRTLLSEAERTEKKIPKYKNTIFKKSNYLFGLYENKQSILDQGCVYIVEGQFDVIKATECGFTNIVALGSADMTAYQFSVITRYTNNIHLLLDNDEAGKSGRKRIMEKFSNLANITNFYLPEKYKDVDEYFSEEPHRSLTLSIKN